MIRLEQMQYSPPRGTGRHAWMLLRVDASTHPGGVVRCGLTCASNRTKVEPIIWFHDGLVTRSTPRNEESTAIPGPLWRKQLLLAAHHGGAVESAPLSFFRFHCLLPAFPALTCAVAAFPPFPCASPRLLAFGCRIACRPRCRSLSLPSAIACLLCRPSLRTGPRPGYRSGFSRVLPAVFRGWPIGRHDLIYDSECCRPHVRGNVIAAGAAGPLRCHRSFEI